MYFIIGGDYTPPLLFPIQSLFTSCDFLFFFGTGGGSNRHMGKKRNREDADLIKHKYNILSKK